jgi:hypothetical protein
MSLPASAGETIFNGDRAQITAHSATALTVADHAAPSVLDFIAFSASANLSKL